MKWLPGNRRAERLRINGSAKVGFRPSIKCGAKNPARTQSLKPLAAILGRHLTLALIYGLRHSYNTTRKLV